MAKACLDLRSRILSRVTKTENGCWEAQFTHSRNGHRKIWVKGRNLAVHRVMYELERGPIPTGLQVDHLCENTACCNPDHLDVTTHLANIRRSRATGPLHPERSSVDATAATHCANGHEYRLSDRRPCGKLHCRKCESDRRKARWRAEPDYRRKALEANKRHMAAKDSPEYREARNVRAAANYAARKKRRVDT